MNNTCVWLVKQSQVWNKAQLKHAYLRQMARTTLLFWYQKLRKQLICIICTLDSYSYCLFSSAQMSSPNIRNGSLYINEIPPPAEHRRQATSKQWSLVLYVPYIDDLPRCSRRVMWYKQRSINVYLMLLMKVQVQQTTCRSILYSLPVIIYGWFS